MAANPSGAHQAAGELSLANADGSYRQEIGRALSRARARPFRGAIPLNGPWPWQSNALPFEKASNINDNMRQKSLLFRRNRSSAR
jgi:hypothetical protein